MRVIAAVLFLSACAAGDTPEVGRKAVDLAGLRNCATITTACLGLDVVAAAQPDICNNATAPVCFTSARHGSGREYLGALQLPSGAVCAFRRLQGTANDLAILGYIVKSADGTIQYERASFPRDPNGLAGVLSTVSLRAACQGLR